MRATATKAGLPKITFTILFYTLLAVQVIWIFTLPLFPTQDGPVHIYYAHIIAALFSGSMIYSTCFYIQHILPPYSLHYYFLIAAMKFFSAHMAEKQLVAGIVLLTATGFRAFTRTLGDDSGIVSLGVLPLLFHQSLLMGFYNYSLALGLGLWAATFWLRAAQWRNAGNWLAFLFLSYVLMLTHPVPVVLVLTFSGGELVTRMARNWRAMPADSRKSMGAYLSGYRRDTVCFFLSALSLGYIAAFINKSSKNLVPLRSPLEAFLKLLKASPVAAFADPGIATSLYRIALWIVLLGSLYLGAGGILRRTRTASWTVTDVLVGLSGLLVVLYPILPPDINGSFYFSDRLMVAGWLVSVAAASGAITNRFTQIAILGFVLSFTMFVMVLAQQRIRPAAEKLAEIDSLPAAQPGNMGFLFAPSMPQTGLAAAPFWWAGVSYFERSDAILLGSPWLESHYMILSGRAPLLTIDYPKEILSDPRVLMYQMVGSPDMDQKYLPLCRVLFIAARPGDPAADSAAKQFEQQSGHRWKAEQRDWFTVYTAVD
jgi:hypothetical protein